MSTEIFTDFITAEDAATICKLLDPHLADTPRDGIQAALGWGVPSEAARVALDDKVRYDNLEETITTAFKKVLEKTQTHFGVEDDKVCIVNAFYYNMTQGARQQMHCDTCELDGSPLDDKESVEDEPNIWSAILYLNNSGEDYEGGEIWFPKQDIVHAPKVGEFVLFKADVDHPHEVKTVLSGERKCLVFFMGYYSKALEDSRTFSDR